MRCRSVNDFSGIKLTAFVLGTASADRRSSSWPLDCKYTSQGLDQRRSTVSDENRDAAPSGHLSRRKMFGISSALATAALAGVAANAQQTVNTRKAEGGKSASDPGPENTALLNENPNSN